MSQGNAVAPGSLHPSGRRYTLRTELLPVEDLPLAPAWAVELLQSHVNADRKEHARADWQALPSGVAGARFRALVNARQQLQAIVSGEGITINGDSSRSVQRAGFVCNLINARYPHNEIRALAKHFQGVLESNPKWFENDVDRLIAKYTPANYKPEPTRCLTQCQEPPHGGRHYELTMAELLDGYHLHADCGVQGIVLDWTVGEAAERLGVSTGTIKRREAEATAAGLVRRVLSDDRQRSYVVLSVETWDVRSQRIAMPYREDDYAEAINTVRNICSDDDSRSLPAQRNPRVSTPLPAQISARTQRPGLSDGDRHDDPATYAEELRAGADVGSQFTLAHSDAPNAPESVVCVERACAEITHSPGRAPAPAGAPLVAEDLPLTSRLEEQVKRDAEALARCWAGKIAGSKRRTPTRQRTVQAEIRRVARVDQSLDQRIERLADRVDAEFAAGRRPVKRAARLKGLVIQRDAERDARGVRPTPHREKMRMPEADLPDLSAAAAPLGAGERVLSRAEGPPDAMAMYDRLRQARDAYHERQAVTP